MRHRVSDFSPWHSAYFQSSLLQKHCGGFAANGHCAYNRRQALFLCLILNDSTAVLLISRHPDPRLISDREGIA